VRYIATLLLLAAAATATESSQPLPAQPIETVEPIDAQAQFDSFDGHIPGNNVTADYRERFAHLDKFLTEDRKNSLKQYNVLIVHGLMGEVGLKFTKFLNAFDKNQNLIAYLKDQKKAVELWGIEPEFAAFNPRRSIAAVPGSPTQF